MRRGVAALPADWLKSVPRVRICLRCGGPVTRWHEHWGEAERVALPEIAEPRE